MQVRYDARTPIKKFEIDNTTGFIHIKHVPMAQVMVQPYQKEDGSIIYEAKTPENLLNDETVASANHIPVTDDHPDELVTKDNVNKYLQGFTADNAHVENNRLYNDLTITGKKLIDAIKQGKQELSIGFQTNVVPQSGTLNGVHYDALQKNIHINHVAVVDRGRAGHSVRLTADSATAVIDEKEGKQMPPKKKEDIERMEDADSTNSNSNSTASSNSQSSNNSNSNSNSNSGSDDDKDKLIAQLKAEIAQLKKNGSTANDEKSSAKNDSMQAKMDAMQAKIDSQENDLKQTKAKLASYNADSIDKLVSDRLDLISAVKPLIKDPKYNFNGKTNKQLKMDAIKAVDHVGKDFDEKAKNDVYVDAYFDSIKHRNMHKVIGYDVPKEVQQDSAQDYEKRAQELLAQRYNMSQNNRKEDK